MSHPRRATPARAGVFPHERNTNNEGSLAMKHRALILASSVIAVVACATEPPVVVAQASPSAGGSYTSKGGRLIHHQCKGGEQCTVKVTVTSCAPDGSGIT